MVSRKEHESIVVKQRNLIERASTFPYFALVDFPSINAAQLPSSPIVSRLKA